MQKLLQKQKEQKSKIKETLEEEIIDFDELLNEHQFQQDIDEQIEQENKRKYEQQFNFDDELNQLRQQQNDEQIRLANQRMAYEQMQKKKHLMKKQKNK